MVTPLSNNCRQQLPATTTAKTAAIDINSSINGINYCFNYRINYCINYRRTIMEQLLSREARTITCDAGNVTGTQEIPIEIGSGLSVRSRVTETSSKSSAANGQATQKASSTSAALPASM